MPLDKILQKLRLRVNEIHPTLEIFIEQHIQPSVSDCDNLQKQLQSLQEILAVYKFNMVERELSPTFQIHAKISEKTEEAPVEIPSPVDIKTPEKEKSESPKSNKQLSISLNDKFRFINELFAQNNPEYHIAMEQLNTLRTWNESEIYLNSLKSLYGWKDNADVVKHIYSLVKKRFE